MRGWVVTGDVVELRLPLDSTSSWRVRPPTSVVTREELGRGFGRSGLVCGGGFLGLGTLVLLCPRGHTKLDKL